MCTFLMGIHSTLFGPVRYVYPPQHLAEAELVGGNGLAEMGTFVATLIGTLVGGAAAVMGAHGETVLAGLYVAIAILGRCVLSRVPRSPAPQPDLPINWNSLSETWCNLKAAREDCTVFLGLLGISWLWFVGATFLASFVGFANPDVVMVLLATFSASIGLGSLLCGRLSRGRIEIGLVPLGLIGVSVFAIDLFFASRTLPAMTHLQGVSEFLAMPMHWRVLGDLSLLAMFGGLYSVRLYALIRSRCKASHRARIIAANNILNALFMIASAHMGIALGAAGVGIPGLYLATGFLNIVVAVYIYSLVPEFMLRFVAWLLMHTILLHSSREYAARSGKERGRARVQSREFLRRNCDHGGEPASDPIHDGPPHLPFAVGRVALPPREGDPDCPRS